MMTVFITMLLSSLMLVVGLVADGGAARAARADALDEASSAARAAAQMLDEDTLRRDHVLVLDPAAAKKAALDFISTTGDTAVVSIEQYVPGEPQARSMVVEPTVSVTVTRKAPMQFLWAVGIDTISESATATVSPEPGRLP